MAEPTPLSGHLDEQHYDRLIAMSLGGDVPPDPQFDEHRANCAVCRDELERLTLLVHLGHQAGPLREGGLDGPRPEVWDAVLRETGLSDPSGREPRPTAALRTAPPAARTRWISRPWRAALGGAAAAVVVVAAVMVGVAIGERRSDPPAARTRVQATLQPIDAGPTGAGGRARVVQTQRGMRLVVDTHGLPDRAGYYEVWLYDPSSARMVAVGMLGAGARGEFLMPTGIDLIAFNTVDVSAQDYDGNPAHKNSVLRGGLRS